MNRPIRRLCVAGSLVMTTWLGGASIAFAQDRPAAAPAATAADTDKAPTSSTTAAPGFSRLLRDAAADFRRLPSKDSLGWLTFGVTLASVSRPFDDAVTRRISGAPSTPAAFAPGRVIGGAAFQFGSSLITYSVGRATGNSRVADVGGRLLRAQLLAETVTGAMKYSANRARPDGSDALSFPSGHTSVSFASATVLQREFGWKVGVPAYAVASYVGWSRIEHKKHYLSDVVFGAAIGIVAGRTVTVGRGDGRFVVTPVAAHGGGGLSFVWIGQR